jgi:flagellar hook assembly protein FlgD
VVTAVEVSPAPVGAALRAYPNPFNPLTNISFRVEKDARVSLRIYDVHGRLVRTLVDERMAAGPKRLTWDGRDDLGRAMASGAYYLRLQGGGTQVSRTINLLK